MTLEEKINNTGSTSPGVPRLGLPAYQWWQEALHGVASSPGVNFSSSGNYSYATSFPQPITMGAAFDDALIEAVATVVSTEGRAFNNANRSGLDFWTPNINPYKDPRWGRGQETPGEDPFHLKSYVNSLIHGLQGGQDPAIKKVIATCKHFAAYDLESWEGNYRYQFNAIVPTQDLVEYYLQPFQQCARDSNVGAAMCSYNAVNGVPSCANNYLLQTILREHWGWTNDNQWITSDCDAIQNIFMPHEYTQSREQTVADALNAGTDVNCGEYYQQHLPAAIAQGLVNETTLDQALFRQYSSLVKLGYFDGPGAMYRDLSWANVATPASLQLAYTAAVEGITLLKNDKQTLPLNIADISSIAILGDWANATVQLQGNYYGLAPYLHSPLFAAQQLRNSTGNVTVNYGSGPTQGNPTTDNWNVPLTAAMESDVVVYLGGIDISVESEGMDRYSINWQGFQIDLINQVCAMGKPCILVSMGDQLDQTPFINNPNISAILWAGYPGMSGGDAIINLLIGKESPAGRLPVTQYPADYVNQVAMTNMTLRPGENNPGRTYMWYNGSAVYPFGYGLHYTNFTTAFAATENTIASYAISSLVQDCSAAHLDLCSFKKFPITVTNIGQKISDFVTLGFITGQYGPTPYPNKQLVAYERLHNVTAGTSQVVSLPLTLGSLARVDEQGNTVLYPGDYALLIDEPTQSILNFTLTGSKLILDVWPQPPATNGVMNRKSKNTDYESWFG
ncbi:hypothetical protein MMC27_001160 [Xylographa pallens]|nr:hypothetical protein [Xylographa pallens]